MKFQLGEIAIICGLKPEYAKFNGMDAEIVAFGPCITEQNTWTDYMVSVDGERYCVNEPNLRKKRPPIPDEVMKHFDARPREIEPA